MKTSSPPDTGPEDAVPRAKGNAPVRRLLSLPLALMLLLTLGSVPSCSAASSPWRLVVNDQFGSGGVPAHWSRYDGAYGSGPENCARPDHAFVRNGTMRMVLKYRSTGHCGRGWYSAGMMLGKRFGSVDQKISVRFRVASYGGVHGHRIMPMRFASSSPWPQGGEEDYCESSAVDGCTTFLHSSSGRVSRSYRVNLTKWHTMTFVRRSFTIRSYIDGKLRWTYRGNRSTLPATVKRPVLQQECRSSCPAGTTGKETILVDWVKVWNPS